MRSRRVGTTCENQTDSAPAAPKPNLLQKSQAPLNDVRWRTDSPKEVPKTHGEQYPLIGRDHTRKKTTRLGGVAHNGFSMAMMLVTTEEYGDQENGEHFFLDIIETWKNTIVAIFL